MQRFETKTMWKDVLENMNSILNKAKEKQIW